MKSKIVFWVLSVLIFYLYIYTYIYLSVIRIVDMFLCLQDPLSGIIPRTFSNLFDELRIQQVESTVRVSFLEIYNEELMDLLSPTDDSSKLRCDDASKVT